MKKILLLIILILAPSLVFASDCEQRSNNSAFVLFDGKKITIKKAMKKKVAGHYLISRSCFEYYIPTITNYIALRL